MTGTWFVYIIKCEDDRLYTGITDNLKRRIQQHNSGNGCRFTKYRAPVKLIHQEACADKNGALKREAAIKRLTRDKKLGLAEILD